MGIIRVSTGINHLNLIILGLLKYQHSLGLLEM